MQVFKFNKFILTIIISLTNAYPGLIRECGKLQDNWNKCIRVCMHKRHEDTIAGHSRNNFQELDATNDTNNNKRHGMLITVCFFRKTNGAVRVGPRMRHAAPLAGRLVIVRDPFTHITHTGRARRARVPL